MNNNCLKEKVRDNIRRCTAVDFIKIYGIINDSATAYKGIIPEDRWKEPYMTERELQHEIDDGVKFWGYIDNNNLIGVMGIQDKNEVILIRHAYVKTDIRNRGIGSILLKFLLGRIKKPVLIGTWADAYWAISFYQKNKFKLVTEIEKTFLLEKYWDIPERQVETSAVLADSKWFNQSDRD